MKCISIRQPWAWFITRPDLRWEAREAALAVGVIKTIENRMWPTRYRGPVLIHAAKGMTRAEHLDAVSFAFNLGLDLVNMPTREELERGGIVGQAVLADCIPPAQCKGRWHMRDQFGFLLQDIQPLPFTPMRGALGLFDVEWSPASASDGGPSA